MTLSGYVLIDKRTGEVRGGLNARASLYGQAGAERELREFTNDQNREHWAIRPATLTVEEEP
jgi:hypothetical protein